MKFWISVFALVMATFAFDAEAARRLGGGSSVGRQSSNVTQREAQKPAAPNQAQPTAPANATPPVQQGPRWGGMLGGLAAGLGLAWLAHSLGFGEAFGQFILIFLVVMIAMTLIGWAMRRRAQHAAPYAYGGAAPADVARAPRQYSPDKVGNDASARPWERASMAFDAAKYAPQQPGEPVRIGSALEGAQNWGVPAGFDTPGFVEAAKRNFVTLQEAWDKSDLPTLRSMMTDEMLGEIRSQLAERERQQAGQPNRTEVVMLEAQLLGIEDLGGDYMASVEFSGMIREEPAAAPSPFREVWNMTKPKSGASGWLVAGVQALQ
ncbi:Tim44 domain-containing protein [Ramlibacter sp. PS4R-6]|uniref:Tim44 domain-containing protein n=1 Tax=Ramlibacter sp. PS4R-6 TaxID=3133438 RepID=UPI0030AB3F65